MSKHDLHFKLRKLCLVKKIVYSDLRLNLHSFFASKNINEQ